MGAEVEPYQAEARERLEDIKARGQQGRQLVDGALADLAGFMAEGAWGRLDEGYQSVEEFLDAEFPSLADYSIPAGTRRELVSRLVAGGAAQQAIAARLGVSQQTVSADVVTLGITKTGNSGRPRKVIRRNVEPAQEETAQESAQEPSGASEPVPPATAPDGEPAASEAQPEPQEQAPPPCSHQRYVLLCSACGEPHPLAATAAHAVYDELWTARDRLERVTAKLSKVTAERDALAARVEQLEARPAEREQAREAVRVPVAEPQPWDSMSFLEEDHEPCPHPAEAVWDSVCHECNDYIEPG